MKITKSRLFQIIREEVELHEKNNFELDESFLDELTDKQEKKAIDDEIKADKAVGNIKEENPTREDQVIDPQSKKVVEPHKKSGKLEIKIR